MEVAQLGVLGADSDVAVMAKGDDGVALQLPALVGEVPAKEFAADAPGLNWLQSACRGSDELAARLGFVAMFVSPVDE